MPYFGIPIRNGLPIGLGSVAGFGVQQFSPADLFSAGEQGAWYDPSDLTTLFTDSAGTTPVTAVEQFVGLMLDKSKGLVLGPELAPAAYTGTASGGFSITSTSIVRDGVTPAGNAQLTLQATVTSGLWYKITFTAAGLSGDNTIIRVGSPTTGEFYRITSAGTYTIYLPAGVTAAILAFAPFAGTAGGITITNIGIKLIPGNHATSTGTKRPKLAARYNLLTYSEQFDNGAWTKSSATAVNTTATTDPLGGTTADLFYPTSTGSLRTAYQGATLTVSSYTASIYAKAAGKNFIGFIQITGSGGAGWVNLTTGQATNIAAGYTFLVVDAGSGWWKISYTAIGSASLNYLQFFVSDSAGSQAVTANGTDGVFIWGADLRPASQATGLIGPTYQRVVDAATYDAVGFLPYLVADGTDDAMNTGNIVPGTDKAQVFVGLRKLSDATQVIAELSVDAGSNNGSILSYVEAANVQYGLYSKGTNAAIASINSGFAAPNTVVFTGIGNISGDVATLRLNGAQVATSSANQGTGDYLTYPLYLFGRGGTSTYFNGWMYGLIIRFGPNLSTSQIESTEAYLNQKSGSY
jgi:hypothetical protein